MPVFNDKHLSWNWEWARKMYDTSREMGFAFMAGSSLPVTWRTPSVEMPLGARIREALCVCYGGVDSYDFHGLETIQCMVERRQRRRDRRQVGAGVSRRRVLGGAARRRLAARVDGRRAVPQPHAGAGASGFQRHFPDGRDMQRLVKDPVAYRYEHTDGLKCTMLLMGGLVRDFNFAAYVKAARDPWSTQMYLPMPDGRTTLANFFSPLVNNVGEDVPDGQGDLSGRAHAADHGTDGRRRRESVPRAEAFETPHLAIHYQPTKESTFWRT